MLKHPLVTDVVEAAFDVAFQHPLRRTIPTQRVETLLKSVRRGAFRSKSIGVGIGGGLRDGFQCQQIQRLHGAVFHRGDAERPLFSIGFRDIDAAQGQRSISATMQRPDGLESGRRSGPAYAIHARRSLALIFRHSFYGQGFAGKGVGQQSLQSFHLAPAAFPCRLYDTRLQPPGLAFTLGPVNLVPMGRLGDWQPVTTQAADNIAASSGRMIFVFIKQSSCLPVAPEDFLSWSNATWSPQPFLWGVTLLRRRDSPRWCFRRARPDFRQYDLVKLQVQNLEKLLQSAPAPFQGPRRPNMQEKA